MTIQATRDAFNLDKVAVESFPYKENLTAQSIQDNATTIENARLWDPPVILRNFQLFEALQKKSEKVAGQSIRDLVTVNGVRVTVKDGSWGLVRASSNKPELVVVVESPVSEQRMRDLFEAMDSVLRTHPEVGEYNQKI